MMSISFSLFAPPLAQRAQGCMVLERFGQSSRDAVEGLAPFRTRGQEGCRWASSVQPWGDRMCRISLGAPVPNLLLTTLGR